MTANATSKFSIAANPRMREGWKTNVPASTTHDQQRGQDKVDAQHRGVVARGPAVGIDACLEGQEAVDRAQLKPGIGDEHEVAGRIEREPGRKRVAAPEMQEDRNQRDLLRDPQQQLNEICGPALQDSLQAAGNAHHVLPIVTRANETWINEQAWRSA